MEIRYNWEATDIEGEVREYEKEPTPYDIGWCYGGHARFVRRVSSPTDHTKTLKYKGPMSEYTGWVKMLTGRVIELRNGKIVEDGLVLKASVFRHRVTEWYGSHKPEAGSKLNKTITQLNAEQAHAKLKRDIEKGEVLSPEEIEKPQEPEIPSTAVCIHCGKSCTVAVLSYKSTSVREPEGTVRRPISECCLAPITTFENERYTCSSCEKDCSVYTVHPNLQGDMSLRSACCHVSVSPKEPEVKEKYDDMKIADELQATAQGEAYHGNALRVALDMPFLDEDDKNCLQKWLLAGQADTDHRMRLQDIAIKIRKHTQEPEPTAMYVDFAKCGEFAEIEKERVLKTADKLGYTWHAGDSLLESEPSRDDISFRIGNPGLTFLFSYSKKPATETDPETFIAFLKRHAPKKKPGTWCFGDKAINIDIGGDRPPDTWEYCFPLPPEVTVGELAGLTIEQAYEKWGR